MEGEEKRYRQHPPVQVEHKVTWTEKCTGQSLGQSRRNNAANNAINIILAFLTVRPSSKWRRRARPLPPHRLRSRLHVHGRAVQHCGDMQLQRADPVENRWVEGWGSDKRQSEKRERSNTAFLGLELAFTLSVFFISLSFSSLLLCLSSLFSSLFAPSAYTSLAFLLAVCFCFFFHLFTLCQSSFKAAPLTFCLSTSSSSPSLSTLSLSRFLPFARRVHG